MASQSVILRRRSTDQVEQAAFTHADGIERAINAVIRDDLAPGDEPPRWGVGIRALGRGVRRHCTDMEAADAANEDEQLDDDDPRYRREKHAATGAESMGTLREGIRVTYGTTAEAKLGIVGSTPRRPEAVLLMGEQVLHRVDDAVAGPVLRPGFSFDPGPAKAELRAALPLLQVALLDVAREKKEADVTLGKKHAAIEAYDEVFSQVAGLLSALLRAIGEYELASRVRPSQRRPGVTTAVDEESPAGPTPVGEA